MHRDGEIYPAQVLSTASALGPLEGDAGPNCALCTASALGPLERDGGPNCAAGLVLVLSVDTVPQLDTGHYNRVQAGTALATA